MSTPLAELLKQIDAEDKADKDRIAKLENLLAQVKFALESETVQPFAGAPDGELHQRLTTIEDALIALLQKPAQAPVSNTWSLPWKRILLALALIAGAYVYLTWGTGGSKDDNGIPPISLVEKVLIENAVYDVTQDIASGLLPTVTAAESSLQGSLPPSMPAKQPFITACSEEQATQNNPLDVQLFPASMNSVVDSLVVDSNMPQERTLALPPQPPAEPAQSPEDVPPPALPEPPAILPEPAPEKPVTTQRQRSRFPRLQRFRYGITHNP